MRSLVGVVLVLGVAVLAAALLSGSVPGASDAQPEPGVELVEVTTNDTLWPYTSRSRSYAGRTLAINLLVRENPASIERSLRGLPDPNWRPTNESVEEPNVTIDAGGEAVELVWSAAHGGTRYTYVERGGDGRWLDERRQLHTGTYLAARDHVRLYAPAETNGWAAIQVHREYWDWFRLRHTVTDVVDSKHRLVDDLTARSYRPVDRRDDADGDRRPMTVIERATLVGVVLALPTVRRRFEAHVDRMRAAVADRPVLSLGAFVLAVPLSVRAVGVAGELLLAGHSPKLVAAPLFPVLVLGLPTGTMVLARNARPRRAFAVTGTAFLVAIAVDFAVVGVIDLPPAILINRTVLAVGLAAMAAGSAADQPIRRWLLLGGGAVWLHAVLASLGIGIP